jgi:hypothetical protein
VTGSVCLRFDEALRELRYLKTIAGFFLERNESEKIERLAWELQGFQTSRTPSYRWQIPEATPIRTKTAADYEVRSTGCRVYGTISSVWEIEKVDGSRANQVFRTAGLASTTIKVYDASDDSVKADWNMDVGDAASPGCYFHAAFSFPGRYPGGRHRVCACGVVSARVAFKGRESARRSVQLAPPSTQPDYVRSAVDARPCPAVHGIAVVRVQGCKAAKRPVFNTGRLREHHSRSFNLASSLSVRID